jgi:hypothetical protein
MDTAAEQLPSVHQRQNSLFQRRPAGQGRGMRRMSPEELQQRRKAADDLRRKLVRRATGKESTREF